MPITEAVRPKPPGAPAELTLDSTPLLETEPPGKILSKQLLRWAAALGILVIVAVLAWKYFDRSEPTVLQFAQIQLGTIESTVSATGACNAVVSVQVGSQVSGNIKALYADFNTRVRKGQLVALIDPEIFQAKVKQSEAGWRNAQAALENARADERKAEADASGARAAAANQAAAVAKAKVAVSDAEAKLVRRKAMFEDKIISKEDLDTAQATYDQAVAELRAAEAQHDAADNNIRSADAALEAARTQISMFQSELDVTQEALNQARIDLAHTRITAPVDGTVVARRMDVGQTVAASFQAPTIFEIAQDLTKMQVDTNTAESDVGRLAVGQNATFTVDAYPGTLFKGRVTQIRKAPINVQNVVTYDAVIQVANPDLKLFPGMTANVTVLIERKENVLKLPNAALRFRPPEALVEGPTRKPPEGNSGMVYVTAADERLRPVSVKIGISDGNYTELRDSGGQLKAGQTVIVGISSPATSAPITPLQVPRRF